MKVLVYLRRSRAERRRDAVYRCAGSTCAGAVGLFAAPTSLSAGGWSTGASGIAAAWSIGPFAHAAERTAVDGPGVGLTGHSWSFGPGGA